MLGYEVEGKKKIIIIPEAEWRLEAAAAGVGGGQLKQGGGSGGDWRCVNSRSAPASLG